MSIGFIRSRKKGLDIKRNLIKTIGSTILIVSVFVSGCNAKCGCNAKSGYMIAVPDTTGLDWDNYEVAYLNDYRLIENEDLEDRAEALVILDGLRIIDPKQDQEYGLALGDGEYMFVDGFRAELVTDDSEEVAYAYRMTQGLFMEYMVLPYHDFDVSKKVNGNIIIYTSDDGSYSASYNMDTGIGVLILCTNN